MPPQVMPVSQERTFRWKLVSRGEAPPDSVDPKSVTKNSSFWLPMVFAESSVTKEGRFWLPMG